MLMVLVALVVLVVASVALAVLLMVVGGAGVNDGGVYARVFGGKNGVFNRHHLTYPSPNLIPPDYPPT